MTHTEPELLPYFTRLPYFQIILLYCNVMISCHPLFDPLPQNKYPEKCDQFSLFMTLVYNLSTIFTTNNAYINIFYQQIFHTLTTTKKCHMYLQLKYRMSMSLLNI